MSIRSASFSLGLLLLPIPLVVGCTPPPLGIDRALHVDAFDPEGRTSTDPSSLEHDGHIPVVFAFEPGDEIDLIVDVAAEGYVEPIDDHRLRIVRPFELCITPLGVFVREPDGAFERRRGTLWTALSLSEASRRNEMRMSFTFEARR